MNEATRGSKRTLVARLMAGSGCVFGVLGFLAEPPPRTTGAVDVDWFGIAMMLLLFAIYLIADGALAFQKYKT